MSDQQPVPHFDEFQNTFHTAAGIGKLLVNVAFFILLGNGISTQGDNDGLFFAHVRTV